MTSAILDTNVVVQALISSPNTASARVVDACFDAEFRLVHCPPVVDEYLEDWTWTYRLHDRRVFDKLAQLAQALITPPTQGQPDAGRSPVLGGGGGTHRGVMILWVKFPNLTRGWAGSGVNDISEY